MSDPKANSLLALGYQIQPQDEGTKDSAGVQIVAVVYKPIYIKKTKRGKLKAYKEVDGKVETTIEGLYNFEVQGNDLVGQRIPAPAPKVTPTQEPVTA